MKMKVIQKKSGFDAPWEWPATKTGNWVIPENSMQKSQIQNMYPIQHGLDMLQAPFLIIISLKKMLPYESPNLE